MVACENKTNYMASVNTVADDNKNNSYVSVNSAADEYKTKGGLWKQNQLYSKVSTCGWW